MRATTWRALVGVALVTASLVGTAAPASARAVTVAGRGVAPPADLSPAAVEAFLTRVQAVQHSTSLAFLAGVNPALRAAVVATVTRPVPATVTVSFGRYGAAAVARLLSPAALAAGWSCGWAQKTVSYRPGSITYYWLELHTDLCSNGYAIAATPSSWHNGSASWGWSYSTAWTQGLWFPYPTEWLAGVGANMTFGFLVHNHPWIKFFLYGDGYVTTQWVTT